MIRKVMGIKDIEGLFDQLFPINRSITGKGYRSSLELLKEWIPFDNIDIASGTKVFDWEVPDEWEVLEAYILDPERNKIVDYEMNNLHVINYSAPIDEEMELEDLKKHLHSIPELPEAVPYITSYYKKIWGFCLSHNQLSELKPGRYRAVIRSHFRKGHIRIGECVLPGASSKEILLSSYLCHPSMANNELGGPIALAYLYNKLAQLEHRHFTYRFVINPETIGSLGYLSRRFRELQKNMIGGIVLNCLGGPNDKLSYKFSKYSGSLLDNFFARKHKEGQISTRSFSPFGGSDERQYNSRGINLPVGQFARTVYEEHPEYHNSLDNKEFLNIFQLEKSCEEILEYLIEFDNQPVYFNPEGYGEYFLSKHNLYPSVNSNSTRRTNSGDNLKDGKKRQKVVMNLLCYCDKKNSILDIAERIDEDPEYVLASAELLEQKGLLEKL